MVTAATPFSVAPEYEAPALVDLGSFEALTQHACVFGKQFGGSDGIAFMGIGVPISNCSS